MGRNKIKVFSGSNPGDVEDLVNNFIKDKNVIDIQMSNSHFYVTEGDYIVNDYCALVIYDEA